MIVDEDYQTFGTTYKDFTPGGYSKITFWAKGALSPNTAVTFSGPHEGEKIELGTLTNSWKQYTISLNQLTGITAYFSIIFGYSGGDIPGTGGFVYLDDIRYTK